MKLKRRKKMRVKAYAGPIRCPKHLQWVRGFECAAWNMVEMNHGCDGKVQAAHTRTGTDGSLSKKPGDNWAIPLCAKHHERQHKMGEPAFEHKYGIDMKRIAADLWERSPAGIRYRAEQRERERA